MIQGVIGGLIWWFASLYCGRFVRWSWARIRRKEYKPATSRGSDVVLGSLSFVVFFAALGLIALALSRIL